MSTFLAPSLAVDPWEQMAQMWPKIRASSAPRPVAPVTMTPDPMLRIATAVRNALTPARSYIPSVSGWHVSPEMIQSLASMNMASDRAVAEERAQAVAEQRAQAQDDLARQRMALKIQNEADRPTPEEQFKMQVAGNILANQYTTQKAMDLQAAGNAAKTIYQSKVFENEKALQKLKGETEREVAGIYRGGGEENKPKFMMTDQGIVALDPQKVTATRVPVQDTRNLTERIGDWMSRKAIPMGNLMARFLGLQQGQEKLDTNSLLRAISMAMNPNSENLPAYAQPPLRRLVGADGIGAAQADPYTEGASYKGQDGSVRMYMGNGQWGPKQKQ